VPDETTPGKFTPEITLRGLAGRPANWKNGSVMNMEQTSRMEHPGPSFRGAPAGRRERAFELSLPALVSGQDASGRRFEERTDISSISAQEVSFRLKTRILVGSKVVLNLDVPRTLILEKPLRLLLSGSVVSASAEDSRGRRQNVSARLDRAYRLLSNS
jgi:hypothetical protein